MSFVPEPPSDLNSESLITSSTKDSSLSPNIEYVYLDEHPFAPKPAVRASGSFGPLPMRTGYDKLLYGCGTAYLGGLSYGAIYGTYRGLQTARIPSFKVRMNSILNMMGRYGPWAANSMAVMTLGWATIDNSLALYRETSDYYNHIGSAFVSGLLFKSTAGLRPALLTGTILASVVSAYGVYDKVSSGEWKGFSTASVSHLLDSTKSNQTDKQTA